MLVYHASNQIVEKPIIINRLHTLDFGSGFYTTTNKEQAGNFATKVYVRRQKQGVPTVNCYEFEHEKAKSALRILEFSKPDTAWLEFVVANRRGEKLNQQYDIIIGPVANDDVFTTITLYESGEISKEIAIERFKVKKLFNQILFCNAESLKFLRYIENESLEVVS